MAQKHPVKKIARRTSKSRLATLIGQATADCYYDSEAETGFVTMIEDTVDPQGA